MDKNRSLTHTSPARQTGRNTVGVSITFTITLLRRSLDLGNGPTLHPAPGVATSRLVPTPNRVFHTVLSGKIPTAGLPFHNHRIAKNLPECYQMLPSFGSIAPDRVATNSEAAAICVAKTDEKNGRKLPNATIGNSGPAQELLRFPGGFL